ncbi:MAG: 2-oxoacid:acceptor oxidoreductase family protein [Varibaculum sp.]|nr:2-oxoacid:acceptor oxidoreductase family protein [Varibaculum sp.]
MSATAKYPGKTAVINGNGAVARVMNMVCGGVIGYPITPSTEISETFEAALAQGQKNVWGQHPFFFEPEGEHSAQSGAMGAALTGGKFISNASSSQGILYGLESHYVTVGKRVGGFVLQVAARVVSRHSLNVMGGHDDVYSLVPAGYTILFGANPEEAADLAAISYRTAALSLVPVANCMDGFATSHMMSEARLPEPELLKEYLGDPTGRIECPTVAQDILFGAKGRVFQFGQFLKSQVGKIPAASADAITKYLENNSQAVEADSDGQVFDADIAPYLPVETVGAWRRQWVNAPAKGTRAMIPALVDLDNPGLTGPVQNQPDFQAGIVDHRTHFAADVPNLVRRAMTEYNELTGRDYAPVKTYMCEDADYIMVGLGSICEDVQAVLPHLRAHGIKAGLVQVTLLQPFPEAELVEALRGAKHVTVLERSDQSVLTGFVNTALLRAGQNAVAERYPGIPALTATEMPILSTGYFGLGGHDVQPRHLIATYKAMEAGDLAPMFYIGSTFFTENATGTQAEMQERLRAAYPDTEKMALHLEPNPAGLLPAETMRIRFHSVGGYGTIATGKLLTDILAEMLHLHSKAAPKYGSEKSGAATNYYITLSPEPIKITNAELEDVEIVVSPDHMVFSHTNPLKGLAEGGTFILQSSMEPEQVWTSLPQAARETIRRRHINMFILDAFQVAKEHAPNPGLETRMMGVAFIGAIATKVDRIASGADEAAMLEKIHEQLNHKFGSKGEAIVEANMRVVREGAARARRLDWETIDHTADAASTDPNDTAGRRQLPVLDIGLSEAMCTRGGGCALTNGLFDRDYFSEIMAEPFTEGTISEAPVYPGAGFFMPPASAAAKDKGLFRRQMPVFTAPACTGCMECTLACPDAAIPNTVFTFETLLNTAAGQAGDAGTPIAQQAAVIGEKMREALLATKARPEISEVFTTAAGEAGAEPGAITAVAEVLAGYPVARTRPFFDSAEKQHKGKGALFSVTIDPWKCTGCLECVAVCSPGALVSAEQTPELLADAQSRFRFYTELPNTPETYSDPNGGPSLDLKRLFLDRDNYYSTIGGHGACRGCGEVTAIRQTMALANSINNERVAHHRAELASLVEGLQARLDAAEKTQDSAAIEQIGALKERLEHRLYRYEGPAGGRGPAGTVIANSTGCSSVYASTAPYNSYQEPWVNGLFQDAQPLAKGMFEGLAADLSMDVLAMRQARALLEGTALADLPSDPPEWHAFTDEELALMPAVMSISGDGAAYDIGFGAMSRILASGTPVKMLVLNTGAYSNTGGQTSTASLEGQDTDLSRYGQFKPGKTEQRKELGLLAAMHPNVLVISTATAYQAHFLKNVSNALAQTDYPALVDVYTSCQPEHGIGDDEANEHARLAVKSRISPLFVHEPQHADIADRFIISGNPDVAATWSKNKIAYTDEDGKAAMFDTVYTPADFAYSELRFRKQFSPLPDDAPTPTPIAEYVELDADARATATPFIYVAPGGGALQKIKVSEQIVKLTEQCRDNWKLLQYLAGADLKALRKENGKLSSDLEAQVTAAAAGREELLDQIAKAFAEVAATGTANTPMPGFGALGGAQGRVGSTADAPGRSDAAAEDPNKPPFFYDPATVVKCTDCKTCYQELPEFFQASTEIIDGKPTPVATLIPGSIENVQVTEEMRGRIAKVIANCDAEIIL